MRPGLIAVRAINQYRRRDILAYLGLRYYLENDCSKRDIWAREVSIHLVNTRVSPVYFRSYHFKEIDQSDSVVHRNIYVPGPNEILAESILLHECSIHPAFKSLPCVYSYRFPKPHSNEGVFQNYFPGFKERHNSIAEYCSNLREGKVLYTDIKKFYPSISEELAVKVWISACDSSKISSSYREFGERLLTEYSKTAIAQNEKPGVLTGPMFSHLIANMILAEVDKIMFEGMEGRYWRYVDDIVLVGDAEQINKGRKHLNSVLSDMGFSLHTDDKDFIVDSAAWLEGINDFDDSESKVWSNLIANIKRFLLVKPDQRIDLSHAFSENGINIPLLDYSNIVTESSYLNKLYDWIKRYSWAIKAVRAIDLKKLVRDAIQAREIYQNRMNALLDKRHECKGYERKRLITKLRFYAGRLAYLAHPDILSSISLALANYPELVLWSRIMSAINSRDVSNLLKLGTNAVQASAQVLRSQSDSVHCSLDSFGEVELQGLAILRLNGITVNLKNDVTIADPADPLNQFALGDNPAKLMKSDNPFIREIACLRGIENPLRHISILDTAFDEDEQLIFDIINQLLGYSYF